MKINGGRTKQQSVPRKRDYIYDLASSAKYLEQKMMENIISFTEVKMIIIYCITGKPSDQQSPKICWMSRCTNQRMHYSCHTSNVKMATRWPLWVRSTPRLRCIAKCGRLSQPSWLLVQTIIQLYLLIYLGQTDLAIRTAQSAEPKMKDGQSLKHLQHQYCQRCHKHET